MTHQGNCVTTRSGERVAFVAGLRTPFARQGTELKALPAVELGKMVVRELLLRANVDPKWIDQVVFGQVIQMPEAPNIAREIVLGTGMAVTTDAYSVSRACATSFQAVASVAESIMAGSIQAGIAGGADSSSVLPIGVSKPLAAALLGMSKKRSWGDKLSLLSHLHLRDLLPVPLPIADYSTGLSMGQIAEQMAKTHNIARQDQDEFAFRSHQLAQQAWSSGDLSQQVMVAFPEPYTHWLEQDNTLRPENTLDDYAMLKPVFDRRYGSVTAGNSSPLTDGGSAVLLMKEGRAKELGLPVLGYLRSYAFAGIEVLQDMLMGPAYATPIALDRAGVTLKDLTLIDMHEAFASQVLANVRALGSDAFSAAHLGRSAQVGEVDWERFNVQGGSIAYGHPFAATGTRMITQTLYELRKRGGGLGLTTACAAGGLGVAMVLEAEL